jgi:hypothetical protein
MSATTTAVVPAEKAEHIDNIFEGLVAIGCQLAMSSDGIRDGIVLHRVFKKDSIEAQQFCLAAGVLVAEGWLSMVVVQGEIKGFIRKYPKTSPHVLQQNILQFPVMSTAFCVGQTRVRLHFRRTAPMMSISPLDSGSKTFT